MKQLLIVKSGLALNAKADNSGSTPSPKDLSNLAYGALSCYQLDTLTALAAEPTDNFAIALGRKSGPAFLIPEVDLNTLKATKAIPAAGTAFTATIRLDGAAVVNDEYTLILVKKGTVPHERNTWTVTFKATSTSANPIFDSFQAQIDAMLPGKFTITFSQGFANVTCNTTGEQWDIKLADALSRSTISARTEGAPAIGDKAYIENLASMCAAGKGFNDTYADGGATLPGYPEEVEDVYYAVYTLRFAVGRDSAKTRDERVSQIVHIAVPRTAVGTANAIETTLDKIFSQPVLPNAPVTSGT